MTSPYRVTHTKKFQNAYFDLNKKWSNDTKTQFQSLQLHKSKNDVKYIMCEFLILRIHKLVYTLLKKLNGFCISIGIGFLNECKGLSNGLNELLLGFAKLKG